MSILDMFRSTPAPAATPAVTPEQPTQQPAPVGNIQDPATVAANSTVATQLPIGPAADPANLEQPNSPLADYTKLWDTVPNTASPATPVALNQDSVAAVVAKTDFSTAVTQDQLAAISAGGEGSIQAFSQAMNAVAQQVMVQSTMVNNKLTEKAIEQAINAKAAEMPNLMRQQSSAAHLKDSDPLFSNPAVQPVIQAAHSQLLAKFPTASPAEITQMTQDYVIAMGKAFTPQAAMPKDPNAGDFDWDSFLT